jgi:dihydrolipoamide dehydrogenase
MPDYDIAILGAGPGGYAAALRAAQRGLKVCLVETGKIGGTCLNVGCIPTKAMLHASELFHLAAHGAGLGIQAQPTLDYAALAAHVAKAVTMSSRGVEFLLKKRGVEVVGARGRLIDAATIDADGKKIFARSVILATGSRPARPAFLPWDSGRVFTTDQATTASALPKSVLIVGGGVIGCEFATFYSEMGVPVTVVEMTDSLLPNLDADAAKAVAASLARRNVAIVTGARIDSASERPDGIALRAGQRELSASHVLAAVGRPPNVEDIGLEALGVAMDGLVVKVDDRCRTNVPGLYAIGDLAERRQYAHLATRMGLVAADNAAGIDARDDRSVVPVGVYTHPEVAAVGLSASQAQADCPDLKIASFPYQASGMARAYAATEGLVRLLARPDGTLLGAMIIGQHATDSIHEIALAMRCGLKVGQIAELIHAHPTFAEAIGEAAEAWLGLPLHTL